MKDQLNRTLQFPTTPKRIISLVPSQTELLCDLGLEDAIVGITKFCVHPKQLLKEKPIVGGTKQLHLNKIKALQPDVILCNKEENTQDIVEACEEIAPVHISDIYTVKDSLELIHMYGVLFSVEEQALKLSNAILEKQQEFHQWVSQKPSFKVAYFIWKKPWMVAANNTFINHLLTVNHFKNVYENLERYPEITLEEQDVSVDYVLLSSEPYPFKEAHKEVLKAFYPNANMCLVDGEMFSWYGSRLVKAFDYFKTLHLNHLN